jgi:type II secretory pathway component PulF
MAVAARQMSTLLDAGIPLIQSLRVLSDRSQHPHLRRVFKDVTARVERGENLSSALSAHPRIFSRLFVGVAKIGESAGILDRSMLRLAEVLEQRVSIRRQIGAALAYPAVAICVAIVILLIIFGIAIPKFSVIYEDIDVQLPTITQIILGVAHFVQGYYWLYLPLAVLLLVVCVFWSRTSGGRQTMDTVRLRAPILGKITRKIYTARASRTMANLLEAGIPLLETLSLTSGTSENHHVARALDRVRDSVERGGKMEPPLRESNIFPAVAVDMVAIGDEAGSLDFMLRKIAENYETEVESTLRGVSSIIEPVLIIFLGFVVLMIALGALLPYFSLVGVVGVE